MILCLGDGTKNNTKYKSDKFKNSNKKKTSFLVNMLFENCLLECTTYLLSFKIQYIDISNNNWKETV